MTSEYVPTDEDIRDRGKEREEAGRTFDRWIFDSWLAEHDAQLLEKLADAMLAGITTAGSGEHILIDDAHEFLTEQAQARREQA